MKAEGGQQERTGGCIDRDEELGVKGTSCRAPAIFDVRVATADGHCLRGETIGSISIRRTTWQTNPVG